MICQRPRCFFNKNYLIWIINVEVPSFKSSVDFDSQIITPSYGITSCCEEDMVKVMETAQLGSTKTNGSTHSTRLSCMPL